MAVAIIMIVASLVGGCTAINKKLGIEDDNPVEEFIEDQIQDRLDIDIDLSGGSPE